MPSFLDDTFLGEPADEGPVHVGSASSAMALGEEPAPMPVAQPMMRLPGGIIMPRSTALILLAVAIAVAIYLYQQKKRKESP